MPITKIQLRPGLVRDSTSYTNEGGWYYCDMVRFRNGNPEKMSGWTKTSTAYVGTCTALLPWASLAGTSYDAVGTNLKYYINYGDSLNDITPIRRTASLGMDPIATTSGSATLTITDTDHGAYYHDYVTISGSAAVNGIPADEINAEHYVTRRVDANTYEITVTSTASGTGSGGGGAVTAEYQLNVGLDFYVFGDGYGAGSYGSGPYGDAATDTIQNNLRLWSQCNFGEDLVFNPRNGALYYWDTSAGTGVRGVALEDMAGASDVPVIATCVLATDSRHVVALGCNPYEDPPNTTQDPLLIRWSDRESAVDWTPTPTNTAGDLRLTIGSQIITAKSTRLETLIWTDAALYGLTFQGGELEFGLQLLGTPISIRGPNAVAIVGGTAYWMGNDKFYVYNGTVNTLPCPLLQMLRNDFNDTQGFQVMAGSNESYTEVLWFYCSANSTTIDRYIAYNYLDNVWYFGTMARTAWFDSGVRPYPLAADPNHNVLVSHDRSVDDNSTATPAPITAYIESSDFDLGDGHQFLLVSRVLPDLSFVGSTATTPTVTLVLKTRNAPGNTWNTGPVEPTDVTVTSIQINGLNTSPIETFTPEAWVRLRGRQAVFRIESTELGVAWQLGALRFDVRPDGRR